MISVITGDIENSGKNLDQPWLQKLKDFLAQMGQNPEDWEIYRGDEFQLRIAPANALKTAFQLKAAIKMIRGMDVRMAIGIGDETYHNGKISEANGTAYTRSGRMFSELKDQKIKMAVRSGREEWDRTVNLMLRLGSDFMDDWSQVSAEIIFMVMARPEASQQELADLLAIKQSAISQRQKRARWPLVQEMLSYYESRIKLLS